MNKLFLLLCFFPLIEAMQQKQITLIPHTGRYFVRVLIQDSSIFVEDDISTYRIPLNNMNQLLRDILKHNPTGKFIAGEYVHVSRTPTGKYYLSAKISNEDDK